MDILATDQAKLAFLLEGDLVAHAAPIDTLDAEAKDAPPKSRPKYVTNYIGSKQKLIDWI